MLVKLVSNSWPLDPPASASQSAGITGMSHHIWPILNFLLYKITNTEKFKAKFGGAHTEQLDFNNILTIYPISFISVFLAGTFQNKF